VFLGIAKAIVVWLRESGGRGTGGGGRFGGRKIGDCRGGMRGMNSGGWSRYIHV
jgi:hypothetical protein